jgi:NAD(P)-dependent dehydrogenase (short-subunit alcohol dehydrogenase family)
MGKRLQDKRVLVTGGGTGIGREIAHAFRDEGARVVICGRRHGPLKATAEELGESVQFVECDISDPADVNDLAARTKELLGGLDILVNNAGFAERGRLEDTTPKVWERMLAINLTGAYLVTNACLPMLKESAPGSNVLNISSTLGLRAEQHQLAYSVCKSGLNMFTRCCAVDYAETGIRFNAVCPGIIDTPMQDVSKGELGYQEWRAQMEQMHPLRAIGLPRDVAAAALFLCSQDADWMTGVILPVDGGITAGA